VEAEASAVFAITFVCFKTDEELLSFFGQLIKRVLDFGKAIVKLPRGILSEYSSPGKLLHWLLPDRQTHAFLDDGRAGSPQLTLWGPKQELVEHVIPCVESKLMESRPSAV
jgi:hypothetical protein